MMAFSWLWGIGVFVVLRSGLTLWGDIGTGRGGRAWVLFASAFWAVLAGLAVAALGA